MGLSEQCEHVRCVKLTKLSPDASNVAMAAHPAQQVLGRMV